MTNVELLRKINYTGSIYSFSKEICKCINVDEFIPVWIIYSYISLNYGHRNRLAALFFRAITIYYSYL